jgi:DNA-binding Xre family transcriptional regulator
LFYPCLNVYHIKIIEKRSKIIETPQNLSVLKTGKANAIRFDTLEKICAVLECQPGDILAFAKEESAV